MNIRAVPVLGLRSCRLFSAIRIAVESPPDAPSTSGMQTQGFLAVMRLNLTRPIEKPVDINGITSAPCIASHITCLAAVLKPSFFSCYHLDELTAQHHHNHAVHTDCSAASQHAAGNQKELMQRSLHLDGRPASLEQSIEALCAQSRLDDCTPERRNLLGPVSRLDVLQSNRVKLCQKLGMKELAYAGAPGCRGPGPSHLQPTAKDWVWEDTSSNTSVR